jgi:urea transport system substrate-binding protein
MTSSDPIRVGVLHSSTGTMALSETSLRDVILMEVGRINADGGLLGRTVEAVVLNPASDWMQYRDMAHTLVHEHAVAAIFGCWTSVSRKSVLPVVEEADALLFYPLQYEGEEQSPNVFYLGATPNQQAIPAIEYLMSVAGGAFGRFFFVGTDYVYPRVTNRILRSFLHAKGMDVDQFPEHYVPFGHNDWRAEIAALKQFKTFGRGAIISTLNGDSNLSFYRAIKEAGFSVDDLPIMALSVSEAELQSLDPEDIVGHYACWEYFMSHPSPANLEFVHAWRRFIGDDRPVYAPMVGAMLGFRLWCKAVIAARTTETPAVRQYMLGQTEPGLNGGVSVMGVNHHIEMAVMVGRATRDRQFKIVWRVPRPIPGDPWAAAGIIADTATANTQRELLEALPAPLIVLNESGEVQYRSLNTNEYFGVEIVGRPLAMLRNVISQVEPTASEQNQIPLPEIAVPDASGRMRHLTVAVRRILFSGAPAHLLCLSDITYIRSIEDQLRVLNAELLRLASTDALTGVNNRRHFADSVTAQLHHLRRHKRPASIFILDLDHFKSLNDKYGHEVGDRALTQAAAVVRGLLRGQDIFARIGGEEFAGYLPDTDIESAIRAAERLRVGIADLRLQVGVETASFTCSIGVTAIDAEADTIETALKRADTGLYAAKREGRDRVRDY